MFENYFSLYFRFSNDNEKKEKKKEEKNSSELNTGRHGPVTSEIHESNYNIYIYGIL